MKKRGYIYLSVSLALLLAFLALTVCLLLFDVRAAGESGAEVGFATINEAVFGALGQDAFALKMSELCGALMIAAVGAFGVTGLVQVIRRKGILRADKELYVMACGLVLLAAAYVCFEIFIVNCRPVLDEGELAASYPSSHTMLAVAVAGMGASYLFGCCRFGVWRGLLGAALIVLATATTILRLLGGVHWLTDIVGGVLLGLVMTFGYLAACAFLKEKESEA